MEVGISGSGSEPGLPGRAGRELTDAEIQRARPLARRVLGRSISGEDLEDCEQIALIRLLRTSRRTVIENLEAMTTTIAKRVAASYHQRRSRVLLVEIEEDGAETRSDPMDLIENCDGLRFLVRELLAGAGGECVEIYEEVLSREQTYEQAAKGLTVSAAALRKRWSRCLQRVRDLAAQCPDPLLHWARQGY